MEHPDDFSDMEKYWSDYHLNENEDGESPAGFAADMPPQRSLQKDMNGYQSGHRISTIGLPNSQSQHLSPHHPALSLPSMLQSFGPLLFPLYRAALLRKRILFMSEAPVELACNLGKTLR